MTPSVPFIPREPAHLASLLSRYLPPIPTGVVTAWLQQNHPLHQPGKPTDWILDPFGTAPHLVVEAARAGYRVIVAANNPVSRFLLELAANPPGEEEITGALAEIAGARKGEERLEPHLRSLYRTECRKCGREIMADAFLWERGASAPYACIYTCPTCNDTGEHLVMQSDLERAAEFSSDGLHRARALERIVPANDPDRANVEEAISVYLPRAIYAVVTIINKLEGLQVTPERRKVLTALLLYVLDRANTLWAHPTARSRPRMLTIPPRFRENNIWQAMEEAATLLAASASNQEQIPLTIWPELLTSNTGITIFEGRLKDLAASSERLEIGSVIAAFPRPNQAYWSLSALWAGWLWGREAASHFIGVLRRRRFDWAWHTSALQSAFRSLVPILPDKTPILGLIGELEIGFLDSAILSTQSSGLNLDGLALSSDRSARSEGGQAQIHMEVLPLIEREKRKTLPALLSSGNKLQELVTQAARSHLLERGEPCTSIYLHAAALSKLSEAGVLSSAEDQSATDMYAALQDRFEKIFTFRNGFVRYGGSDKSPEIGHWWMQDLSTSTIPLSDRIEMDIVRNLQKAPGSTFIQIYTDLCARYPGLLTPEIELVRGCLDSYGQVDDNRWNLRPEDSPQLRRADLKEMQNLLQATGVQLGYQCDLPEDYRSPLIWMENGEPQYIFFVTASAVIYRIVEEPWRTAGQKVIVLPGGRAGLMVYKLRNNPRLRQLIADQWRFLKFRQLRQMAEQSSLTRTMVPELLALDPLAEEDPQMRLL